LPKLTEICRICFRSRFSDRIAVLLAAVILVNSGASGSEPGKKGVVAASISIPVAAAGTAVATFFIVRGKKKDRQHGDSVITAVRSIIDSSRTLFAEDKYDQCASRLRSALPLWDQYSHYCHKRKGSSQCSSLDSINESISRCEFLHSIRSEIFLLDSLTGLLPSGPDELAEADRHRVIALTGQCRQKIDSIMQRYPDRVTDLKHGFQRAILSLDRVDSLFKVIYDQQRDDFNYKNKFYYNRAVESGDSMALRNFLADCDYYQVDKYWCGRVRLALNPQRTDGDGKVEPVSLSQPAAKKKLTAVDSMKIRYAEVMSSARIDLLEDYLKTYSGKRFRKKDSRVDSVKIVLDSLNRIVKAEEQFNKDHPLFVNADQADLTINVLGLSENVERLFSEILEQKKPELLKVNGMRFPAVIKIDYSATPPILFVNAFLNSRRDVERTSGDEDVQFSLPGVSQLMDLLNAVKLGVISEMEKRGVADMVQMKRIRTAAYVVRLNRSASDCITFYAKENPNAGAEGSSFLYYDFFDISFQSSRNIRLSGDSSHTIKLVKDKTDSLKYRLCTDFFQ
jgi:hypothetical protein